MPWRPCRLWPSAQRSALKLVRTTRTSASPAITTGVCSASSNTDAFNRDARYALDWTVKNLNPIQPRVPGEPARHRQDLRPGIHPGARFAPRPYVGIPARPLRRRRVLSLFSVALLLRRPHPCAPRLPRHGRHSEGRHPRVERDNRAQRMAQADGARRRRAARA